MIKRAINAQAQVCQYYSISEHLISARLLGWLRMLPLHHVALDDIECPWRRANKLSYACAESDCYTIKSHF